MDALSVVMIAVVVVAVGLFAHRMMMASQDPTDLPPGFMSVDRFYDQNPLRRSSPEVDLGDGWKSTSDPRCTFSVFWLADTGEVYALRVPNPASAVADGVGDGFGGSTFAAAVVEVLGEVPTREELDERLHGSESKIDDPDGLDWIRKQVSTS